MAKLSFNKLNLKVNTAISEIQYNDQSIEIKEYLPVNEKLEMIS